MKTFEQCARDASFDVRKEYAPLLGTYGVVLSEESAKKVTDIITKHYAQLAELQALLVELAKITKNYFGCDDLYRIDGNPESRGKIRITRDEYKQALFDKMNDPLVAAAIKGESEEK